MNVHAKVAHDEVDLGGAFLFEVATSEILPEKRMAEDLCPIQPLLFIETDAPVDEVAHMVTDGESFGDDHLAGEYLLAEAL